MKLNFWQWLGLICVVVGVIGYVFLKDRGTTTPATTPPAPTTQTVP